ncbi:tocopherol cyclase family protein [Fusibacter bizertensis]|uniref:Tocopherol cyclase family protein n=1 Tax=Fusibacter bizertensis TaxID=1488331 RepID=A0ABT6NEI6_9FIRM|nr:tocopherol cyclase family protein [Fusibacter bizertensis]MDH8678816.1 tocopherol cyclase family protein [Fusibacter bizertensis]
MNKSDLSRNLYMLNGPLAKNGYDWWWHNFTGYNQVTGEEKTFFIEYFICNPELGNGQPILGQLPTNQAIGRKPSYALIKVGAWGKDAKQIHNFYAISDFKFKEQSLDLSIGSCELSETHLLGSCSLSKEDVIKHEEYMCDAGSMSWNLKIDKKIAYNVGYGASKLFRKLNAFEMFWHAEGIKTEYSGTVEFDDSIYDVIPEKSYGYSDKNWGSDFTSPWLWLSSCNMKSLMSGEILENSAIEFGGGKPKVFGKSLNRKLLGGFYYEGKMYDYNFSKFWRKSHIDFEFIEGEHFNTWKLKAENRKSIMNLTLECPVDEMLLINYEAPNGTKKHNRLWNGGTGFGKIELLKKNRNGTQLIDLIEVKNTGCEYGEYDT